MLCYYVNRDERIKELSTKYAAVKARVGNVMEQCALGYNSHKIDEYITKILSRHQDASVAPSTITKLLYERFGDVYYGHINWIFYAAWKFNPLPQGDNAKRETHVKMDNLASYYVKRNKRGLDGVTKNGDWTVLWVAYSPLYDKEGARDLVVNEQEVKKIVDNEKKEPSEIDGDYPEGNHRNAKIIQEKIVSRAGDYNSKMFSGRKPMVYMVITNTPGTANTFGSPPRPATPDQDQLNVWQKRINSELLFVTHDFWKNHIFHTVPIAVDIIFM